MIGGASARHGGAVMNDDLADEKQWSCGLLAVVWGVSFFVSVVLSLLAAKLGRDVCALMD